jgi:hypothetical protein
MLPKSHTSPAFHPSSSSQSSTILIRHLQPVLAWQAKSYTHCTALFTRKSVSMKAAKCLYVFYSRIGLQQILFWIGNPRSSSLKRGWTFLRQLGEGKDKGGITGSRDRIIREAICRKWSMIATISLPIHTLKQEGRDCGDVDGLRGMISGLLGGGGKLILPDKWRSEAGRVSWFGHWVLA